MSENDTPPVYTIDTLKGRLDLVPKALYDEVVAALRAAERALMHSAPTFALGHIRLALYGPDGSAQGKEG